jgi:hypothetical protein
MPQRINAGHVLVAVGGLALFVSLFLNWYEPGRIGQSAWAVFEVLDLVLAAVAIVAVTATLPLRPGGVRFPAIPDRWLPWLGLAAFTLVLITLISDPPAAAERGLEAGAWVGLVGAALLAGGGTLSTARISLEIRSRPPGEEPAGEWEAEEYEETAPLADEELADEIYEPGVEAPPTEEHPTARPEDESR